MNGMAVATVLRRETHSALENTPNTLSTYSTYIIHNTFSIQESTHSLHLKATLSELEPQN